MEQVIIFLKSDLFLYCITGGFIILIILYIANLIRLNNIQKNYIKFMKKLGNGNNIEDLLKLYIEKVEEVEQKNIENNLFCKKLNSDISNCLQKVGIVRYSAFKDIGSDLSFALAILDEKNNGIVLNGIYSREVSNIYAKPVIEGKSKYTISNEEQQAIDIAIKSREVYNVKNN